MAELQHTLVTKEGLEKLQKELDELRTKKPSLWATFLKTPNMMMQKTSSLS